MSWVLVIRVDSAAVAIPRSASLTEPSSPSRTLAGLTSRWTIPFACAWSSAAATLESTSIARSSPSGARSSASARVSPSTYSMTISTPSSPASVSKTMTRFGWLRVAPSRASRRKRSRSAPRRPRRAGASPPPCGRGPGPRRGRRSPSRPSRGGAHLVAVREHRALADLVCIEHRLRVPAIGEDDASEPGFPRARPRVAIDTCPSSVKPKDARVPVASRRCSCSTSATTEDWNDNAERIPGSVHIAAEEIDSRLDELPDDKKILVVCPDGELSAEVAERIDGDDREAVSLDGGVEAVEEGQPDDPALARRGPAQGRGRAPHEEPGDDEDEEPTATKPTEDETKTRDADREEPPMTIAIIVVVCIVLAILAFLLPRLSRHPAARRRQDARRRSARRRLGAGAARPPAAEAVLELAQGDEQERRRRAARPATRCRSRLPPARSSRPRQAPPSRSSPRRTPRTPARLHRQAQELGLVAAAGHRERRAAAGAGSSRRPRARPAASASSGRPACGTPNGACRRSRRSSSGRRGRSPPPAAPSSGPSRAGPAPSSRPSRRAAGRRR